MYHRVIDFKHTIIACLGDKMQNAMADALPLIFDSAGVGKMFMQDASTPWVPKMPIRDNVVPKSYLWVGCHDLIDKEIKEKKNKKGIRWKKYMLEKGSQIKNERGKDASSGSTTPQQHAWIR